MTRSIRTAEQPRPIRLATIVAGLLGVVGGSAAQSPLADWRGRLPSRAAAGRCAPLVIDLDGDGRPDLVRATTTGLEVSRQSAAGHFFKRALLPWPATGGDVVALRALDVGAATPSVVALTTTAVHLYRNSGGGSLALQAGAFPRVTGNTAAGVGVVVGDFDGSGAADVLVTYQGAVPQLFMANGNGGFVDETARRLPNLVPAQSPWVDAADVDRDGDLDLVQSRIGLSTTPVVWLNSGRGLFQRLAAFPLAVAAQCFVLQDVTGDQLADLVVFRRVTTATARPVLFVNQRGRFVLNTVRMPFQTDRVASAAARDLTGDGLADLVIVSMDGTVRSVLQSGGVFTKNQKLLGPGSRSSVTIADIDADRDFDALTSGGFDVDRLFVNDGVGDLLDAEDRVIAEGPHRVDLTVAVADVHGDGDPDLVGYDARGIATVWRNQSGLRFEVDSVRLPNLGTGSVQVIERCALRPPVAAGRPRDLIVLSQSTITRPRLLVARSNGTYADEGAQRWPTGAPALSWLTTAGFTATGGTARVDDVLGASGSQLVLLANSGTKLQVQPRAFGVHTVKSLIKAVPADLNGDNRLDFVTVEAGGGSQVFLQSGTGAFARYGVIPGGRPCADGAVADWNGDGSPDWVALEARSRRLSVALGDGRGGFRAGPIAALASARPRGLAVLTEDKAGAVFVVGDGARGVDVVYRANGSAWSAAATLPKRRHRPTSWLRVADLDLDGDQDLVIGQAGNTPEILFGTRQHFGQVGVCSLGRPVTLRMTTPSTQIVSLLAGAPGRFELAPYGVLRLQLASVTALTQHTVNGQVDLQFPTTLSLPEVIVPMQAAFTTPFPLAVRLGPAAGVRFDRR